MSGESDTAEQSRSSEVAYEFGPFVADPIRGTLHRDGIAVTLTPKAFGILILLIKARSELVSKDTLLAELWPGIVVEENTLSKHVSTLRKALRTFPDDADYVVAVSGRGYRLTVPVRELPQASVKGEDRSHAPGPALVQTPPRYRWLRRVAAMAAVAALLTLLAFRAAERRVVPDAVQSPTLKPLTLGVGFQHQPAWSPNGDWVAYANDVNGMADIWVRSVRDQHLTQITADAVCDSQPAWSPDGSLLIFRSERDGGGLFVVPPFGGPLRRLTHFGHRPLWSPDGSRVLFFNELPLSTTEAPAPYVVASSGGQPLQLMSNAFVGLKRPVFAWHPDGRRISVLAYDRPGAAPTFRTVSVDDGKVFTESRLAPGVETAAGAAKMQFMSFVWSPRGDALYFSASTLGTADIWRVAVDPTTLEWTKGPERLTTGAGVDSFISLSADGRRLAFATRQQRTRMWEIPLPPRGGATAVPRTPFGITPAYADVSPNGQLIAYQTTRANLEELWVRNVQGKGRPRIVAGGVEGQLFRVPRWSRDGKLLATHRGGSSIVVRDDEANDEWPLTTPGNQLLLPSHWSRDSREMLLACEQADRKTMGICRVSVASAPQAERDMTTLAARAGLNLWQARFSPDDRWVAFVAFNAADGRASTVYVMPAQGGDWIPITEGLAREDKPRWSADGRTLYFVSNRSGLLNVWGRRIDPATGRPSGVPFRVTTLDSASLALLPDTVALEISVTPEKLFAPLTEISGQLWVLDQITP